MTSIEILLGSSATIVLLTAFGWGVLWFQKQKRKHELRLADDLWLYRKKARELEERCDRHISILAPVLYESIRIQYEVWLEHYGLWPWEKRAKIVVICRVGSKEDADTVKLMIRGSVSSFRSQAGNQRFRVETQILPISQLETGVTQ